MSCGSKPESRTEGTRSSIIRQSESCRKRWIKKQPGKKHLTTKLVELCRRGNCPGQERLPLPGDQDRGALLRSRSSCRRAEPLFGAVFRFGQSLFSIENSIV